MRKMTMRNAEPPAIMPMRAARFNWADSELSYPVAVDEGIDIVSTLFALVEL
jgi:hypothetical protein